MEDIEESSSSNRKDDAFADAVALAETSPERAVKILESLLEEGMVSGEFVRQDARISAAALVGLLGETILGPLLHSAPAARQSVADSIIALCLRAVGVKP